MNVRVNKEWRITTDPRNFVIEKRRIAQTETDKQKKGDEFWTQIAFYGKLDLALQGLVKHSLLDCPATTFEEVKSCLRSIQSDIKAIKDVLAANAEGATE